MRRQWMLTFKKTIITIIFLGHSTAALYAGDMGTLCTMGNVTMPCDRSEWDFGIQALYLKPSYGSNFHLTSFVDAAGGVHLNELDPKWAFGFRVEGAYRFGSGNDLGVNWTHYSRSTTGTVLSGTAALPVNTMLQLKPKLDAVNAEFGQQLNFGKVNNVRFHAGAQYARIATDFYGNIASFPIPADGLHTKFIGVGPRLGGDFVFTLGHGLGVYANGAGAVLAGRRSFNTVTNGVIDTPGVTNGSKTTMVPELEAKLGITYSYAMAQSDLTLDIGYMWQNYFNSQIFLTINDIGGESGFALQGPYIGLKYLGYV
ncbi:hypothetical protein EKM59_01005 [Legionella septentrionalis]|uniref:Major outer membrane protein n=2 Tax=Legionella septentrionalis TaxID=2498109 RepID=A0A433JMH4_9GAMM|nr:hypothetical protein EKM59_01005 [Legionella septentrionalis]